MATAFVAELLPSLRADGVNKKIESSAEGSAKDKK